MNVEVGDGGGNETLNICIRFLFYIEHVILILYVYLILCLGSLFCFSVAYTCERMFSDDHAICLNDVRNIKNIVSAALSVWVCAIREECLRSVLGVVCRFQLRPPYPCMLIRPRPYNLYVQGNE